MITCPEREAIGMNPRKPRGWQWTSCSWSQISNAGMPASMGGTQMESRGSRGQGSDTEEDSEQGEGTVVSHLYLSQTQSPPL